MDVRYTHGKTMVASLTEPQLLQVLEPPAMAALHLGQVLCIFAWRVFEDDFFWIVECNSGAVVFDDFVLLAC
jgi:hypothetical protein